MDNTIFSYPQNDEIGMKIVFEFPSKSINDAEIEKEVKMIMSSVLREHITKTS